MRLVELEPSFLRYEECDGKVTQSRVDGIAEAQGVMFLCPKCFAENGGRVGTHRVICWSRSRGVPDEARPKPGRWALKGASLEDLTLDAEEPGGARSVLITGGCGWHGFVTAGAIA